MPFDGVMPMSTLSDIPVVYGGMIFPTPLKPAVLAASPFSVVGSVPFDAYGIPGLFIVPYGSVVVGFFLSRAPPSGDRELPTCGSQFQR